MLVNGMSQSGRRVQKSAERENESIGKRNLAVFEGFFLIYR